MELNPPDTNDTNTLTTFYFRKSKSLKKVQTPLAKLTNQISDDFEFFKNFQINRNKQCLEYLRDIGIFYGPTDIVTRYGKLNALTSNKKRLEFQNSKKQKELDALERTNQRKREKLAISFSEQQEVIQELNRKKQELRELRERRMLNN